MAQHVYIAGQVVVVPLLLLNWALAARHAPRFATLMRPLALAAPQLAELCIVLAVSSGLIGMGILLLAGPRLESWNSLLSMAQALAENVFVDYFQGLAEDFHSNLELDPLQLWLTSIMRYAAPVVCYFLLITFVAVTLISSYHRENHRRMVANYHREGPLHAALAEVRTPWSCGMQPAAQHHAALEVLCRVEVDAGCVLGCLLARFLGVQRPSYLRCSLMRCMQFSKMYAVD